MLVASACAAPAPTSPPATLSAVSPPPIEVLTGTRMHTSRQRLPPASVLTAPLTSTIRIRPVTGHVGVVNAVDVAADGRLAVSAGRDGRVLVWDLRSGAELRALPVGAVVSHVALIGDGRRVLTADVMGNVRMWALVTGQRLTTLRAPHEGARGQPVLAIAVAPDGTRAAVATPTSIEVIDIATGKPTATVATTSRVLSLGFTGGASELVSGDAGGELRRYDAATLSVRRKIAGHAREITAIATSADGRRVLSGSGDGRIKLWDVTSGALLRVVTAHALPIRGVRLNGDASRAASASEDGNIKLWNLENGARIATLSGHEGAVTALAAADPTVSVLSGGADGSVRMWDVAAREAFVTLAAHDATAEFAGLSESGTTAMSVSDSGVVRLWDLSNLSVKHRFAAAPTTRAAAFAPDGAEVLTADTDALGHTSLRLWATATGRSSMLADVGTDGVTSVAYSADGRRALVGSALGAVTLWGTAIRRSLRELAGHAGGVRTLSISRDGARALTASVAPVVGTDTVKLWDLEDGTELAAFSGYRVGALGYGLAVLGHSDGHLAVIDRDTLKVQHKRKTHSGAVSALAVGPSRIVSADESGAVHVLAHDLTPIRTLTAHTGVVHHLALSLNGERLLSASADGTMRYWRVGTGASVALVARGAEWLVFADDGTFAASPSGARLAHAVSGLAGYQLDQLTTAFNRPDMLLERLGGSTTLREDFAKRYQERRQGQMPADAGPQSFARTPRVALSGLTQVGRELTVRFIVASAGLAARYQLRVNGVPWLANAKPVPATGSTAIQIEEQVTLGAGRNHVAVHVTDAAGAQAIPASQVVRHASSSPKRRGRLFYLGIGVSNYRASSLSLPHAANDARFVGRALSAARGAYDDITTVVVTDERATASGIDALAAHAERAGVEDTVVLYVAGHWAHTADAAARRVFLPHDADPSRLRQTALDLERLIRLAAAGRARRRLVIVDGCVSGDRDAEERRRATALARRLGLVPRISPELVGVVPRGHLFQPPRLITATDHHGAVVLFASRGAELCFAVSDGQTGALTQAFARALTTADADTNDDGWIDLHELSAFVSPAVASLTGDLQHPLLLRDGAEQTIVLPRVSMQEVRSTPPLAGEPPPVLPPPRGCACGVAPKRPAFPSAIILVVALFAVRRRVARPG